MIGEIFSQLYLARCHKRHIDRAKGHSSEEE
jgi:hypothetical protein